MFRKLLFIAVIAPVILYGDLKSVRKELHFILYTEIVKETSFGTQEFWISVGRTQALAEAIEIIDMEL